MKGKNTAPKGKPLLSKTELAVLKALKEIGVPCYTMDIVNLTRRRVTAVPRGTAYAMLTSLMRKKAVTSFLVELKKSAPRRHFALTDFGRQLAEGTSS